jgi:hypothetical protein
VIALVPLIGFMALGGEAASWYVTKQHAQNAADAAAYSGALRLACTLGLATGCGDTQTVDYRGKQFATQNGFSNTACGSNPGVCVTIYAGTYNAGTFTQNTSANTNNPSGNAVQATVTQTQPAYLAALLGLSKVDIGAQATAQIQNPNPVCGLGLSTSSSTSSAGLTLGGNLQLAGNGCGLMSDGVVKFNSTVSPSGSGWGAYAASGCNASGNTCSSPGLAYNYYMPPVTNPLSKLDSEAFNTSTGSAPKVCNSMPCTLSANSPSTLFGNLTVTTGDVLTFNPGTYFFYNAAIKINGGTVTGTGVTIVLLGDSSLSISGGTVTLSAPATNTTYPDLSGVLFDDQAPNKSNNAVNVNGSGTVSLGGAMYFPNVDVTWSGTTANTNNTCSEVIGNTLTMTGSAYLSSSGCSAGTVPSTQVVTLVQ